MLWANVCAQRSGVTRRGTAHQGGPSLDSEHEDRRGRSGVRRPVQRGPARPAPRRRGCWTWTAVADRARSTARESPDRGRRAGGLPRPITSCGSTATTRPGGGVRRRGAGRRRHPDRLRPRTPTTSTPARSSRSSRDAHAVGAGRDPRRQVDRPGRLHRADARRAPRSCRIVFSPEFLREGRALHDNLHPSRIVVGDRGGARQGLRRAAASRAPLDPDVPVLLTELDRGRGDQALRQHLPRAAGRLLQRARHLRRDARPRPRAGDRGRRPRPADRHPLQQPELRLRRLLPAQGHPAAAGELPATCRRT